MGQSTDGILFYGYCWDDEKASPWASEDGSGQDDDQDWEERYAAAKGIVAPVEEYPEDKDKSPEAEAIRRTFSNYWDAKREVVAASLCEVSSHCSGECPMPYVAVNSSKTTASRGYPQEITSLEVKPEWGPALAEFCATMGITPPQDAPRWWLVSDWN